MARIVWIILIFNLILVVGAVIFYLVKRNNHKCEHQDLEKFCSELPLDAELPDPHVLKNGKWVRRNSPERTPEP